jgi:FlaA1/EpsC-like NDP-sugar epimerase
LVARRVSSLTRSLRDRLFRFAALRGRRTLIIGTGERADRFLREMLERGWVYPLGLISLSDTPPMRSIRGVRIAGAVTDLPAVCERLSAEFAIIALDQGESSEVRRVVDQCIAAGVEFKILPCHLYHQHGGSSATGRLRNVCMDDLLGSATADLDLAPVSADLQNSVVLLTGAAGSIGSELARQIATFKPARLILLDQAETELHFIHRELAEAHPGLHLMPVVCDITNEGRVARVFGRHRPSYVVHAAGYQHLPLMEANACEAVRNNVLGTLLVASSAVKFGAIKVLLLSTDEATQPASVGGATKRIAERIVFGLPNLHRSGTDFRAVRLGDVLASSGGIIPLMERQLAAGGPIAVSHPLACRHLRTIPDVARLALQAGSLPEITGSLAVLEMGEPVRILELAEKLIRFSGRVPGRDVSIVFTGLRPGEHVREDRIPPIEPTVPTSNPKIRIRPTTESLGPELAQKLSCLFACLEDGDEDGLLRALCDLVPECISPLADHRAERGRPADQPSGIGKAGAWRGILNVSEPPRRDRQRDRAQIEPPAEPHINERRQEVVCRRKEARAGGRRRTDMGALLPAGAPASIGGTRLDHD